MTIVLNHWNKKKTVWHVIQLKTHHGTVENTFIFYHFERVKCCNLFKDKILPDMQEWSDARAHTHFHETPWTTFHSFLFVWEEGKASTDYLLFNALYSLPNVKFIFNLLFCSLWVFLANKHEECGKKQIVWKSVIFLDSSGSHPCTLPDVLFKEKLIIIMIVIIINIPVIINNLKLLLKTKCLSRKI